MVELTRVVSLDELQTVLGDLLTSAPDGTVGAPALAFETDPTTGVYHRTDGGVGLVVKGAEALAVDGEGAPVLSIRPAGATWTQPYTLAMLLSALQLNPTIFGAKGDGVTDDTAAVKASVAAGGFYLPAGVYLITDYTILTYMGSWDGPGSFLYAGTTIPAGNIVNDLVFNVPSVCPTIQQAVTLAQTKANRGTGTITIKIADGTYNGLRTISPLMADGATRLYILGNEAALGNVILNFDATNNGFGFLATNGNGIAMLNGMTIIGVGGMSSAGVWNEQCYGAGVSARNGSVITCGGAVRINNFYYGVQSQYGSTVTCGAGFLVYQAGDAAYLATNASMTAQNTLAISTAHTAQGLGVGYRSEYNGYMDCASSGASYSNVHGFVAADGFMSAKSCTASYNSQTGFLSIDGGRIDCSKATAIVTNSYNNGGIGYYSVNGSYLNANSCLSTSNGLSGFQAENGATMDITAADASTNGGIGFQSVNLSNMNGDGATAFKNKSDGFNAGLTSTIRSSNSTSNSNAGWGYYSTGGSFIDLVKPYTSENNTLGDLTPALATEGNQGAWIVATGA
jgi:hypothetical protein